MKPRGRLYDWFFYAGITLIIAGGCASYVRVDYRVQKQKYPSLTTGGYIWNKLLSH